MIKPTDQRANRRATAICPAGMGRPWEFDKVASGRRLARYGRTQKGKMKMETRADRIKIDRDKHEMVLWPRAAVTYV